MAKLVFRLYGIRNFLLKNPKTPDSIHDPFINKSIKLK